MNAVTHPCNDFDMVLPVVIVGGGACGLTAALAARDAGAEVLVVERDPVPRGTTAMSTGLIPAAGTEEQRAAGIDDSPETLAADILAKAKGQADAALVTHLAQESAETVAWLRDKHHAPLSLVTGFLYPGHSRMRMVGTPNRTGEELMASLLAACAAAGVDILTDAVVRDLEVTDDVVGGLVVERPDGARERIGCQTLILACCGFAGNEEMVRRYIPELEGATFHGHPGNKGDAVRWGESLGASLADMNAYQGHGGLAYGHGIPILWPLIVEGGFQVNRLGQRFSNEALGYSEQAVKIVAQPERVAWSIFDERLHQLMLAFDDYQAALKAGAVIKASTIKELAQTLNLPSEPLAQTVDDVAAMVAGDRSCSFGRDFTGKPPLAAPFYAAKVTGALFHTQGGLEVDKDARVRKASGGVFPNLFAGGGAARGISGPGASGYIAGNGLLTATTLGKLAGRAAARQIQEINT
jgi:fumarate reductase flavoprotein subunit